MAENLLPIITSVDLLELLRLCAERLLFAWQETKHPALWIAFEKTSDACQWVLHSQSLVTH